MLMFQHFLMKEVNLKKCKVRVDKYLYEGHDKLPKPIGAVAYQEKSTSTRSYGKVFQNKWVWVKQRPYSPLVSATEMALFGNLS